MPKTPKNFEELRRRLLQSAAPTPSQGVSEASQPAISLATEPAVQLEEVDDAGYSPIQVAVAKAFECVRPFEERFTKLQVLTGQVDRLGREAVSALESTRTLADRLELLAAAFEQVRDPYQELAELAHTFKPLGPLHSPIADLLQTLHEESKQLVKTLQAAAAFHRRLFEMAVVFRSAEELQKRFELLAAAFTTRSLPPVNPPSQGAHPANEPQG